MANTRFERLKAKLIGKMPVVETPHVDWSVVIQALHKRLYTGWKAPKIDLIRPDRKL